MDSTEKFREELGQAGLEFAGPIIADGSLHRFRAGDDRSKNSWYVCFAGPPMAGAFGCWKRGVKENWCAREPKQMSQTQWAEVRQHWQDAQRECERKEVERQAKARKTAAWILHRAKAAQAHPYLENKGVKIFGEVAEYHGDLVVPLRDASGELHSLQFIGADGSKKFLSGGRVVGCFFMVAHKPDSPLVICEGYATGASIHEATGHDVICAMNCGNL